MSIVVRSIVMLSAICCLCFSVGCSDAEPGFGGVQGTVTVDSQPAPVGTRVKFRHIDDQSSFFAIVGESGMYSYEPPVEAPLKTGEYQVGVEPVASTTTVDGTGLAVESAAAGKRKSYGKYSDPSESGLTIALTEGHANLDIDVATN